MAPPAPLVSRAQWEQYVLDTNAHMTSRPSSARQIPTQTSSPRWPLPDAPVKPYTGYLEPDAAREEAKLARMSMLQKQLFAAIGKHIQPKDFAEYMSFHHKKLFHSRFAPAPFCYAIRRPDHYPDGTLAIEDGSGEPVSTITRRVDGCHDGADGGDGGSDGGGEMSAAAAPQTPMSFAINAATRVHFTGERYLHALLATTFAGSSGERLSLVARAAVLLFPAAGGQDRRPRHLRAGARHHPAEQGRAHDPAFA